MDLTYGPVTSTVAVMTTSAQSSAIPVRLPFEERAAGFYRAVVRLDHAATEELDRAGIDARLRDLVRIRASQLNGCPTASTCTRRTRGQPARPSSGSTRCPAWPET